MSDDYNDGTNTDALQFGSFIHKVFEDGYTCDSVDGLLDIAKALRSQFTFGQEKGKLTERCIHNFFHFNKNLEETVSAEMQFSLDVGDDLKLNGIIDRVIKGTSGKYLVIDYKTSKRPASKKDLYNDPQMIMYTLAIHKTYNVPIPDITAAHYYPHLDKLVPIKYMEAQVLAFERKMKEKAWEIRKRKKVEFPPCINRFCDWCGYKDICPAFGATEMDIEKAIKESREKKAKST